MDFGKAFIYMFEDPEWVRKLGIAALVALAGLLLSPILVGLIAFVFLAGYSLDVTRNVIHREQHPLPEWEDWGGFFVRGLKLSAAIILWSLPAILSLFPILIGTVWMGNADSNGGGGFGGMFLLLCGTCLAALWSVFVTVISPAIYVHLAETDRFSSVFELNELWSFTTHNLGNVIVAVLLTWVAGLIAAAVGSAGALLCGVGVLITIPIATVWQYLVTAHLFGQIGAVDRAALSDALDLAPAAAPPEE